MNIFKSILTICAMAFYVSSSIAAPPSSPSPEKLLAYEVKRIAGDDTISTIAGKNKGSEFLDSLYSNELWLRDLLDSGPVRNPERVLSFLHRVWLDDKGFTADAVDRSMATACGLALGSNTRLDPDWMWERYLYFRDSWDDGFLNECYGELATWERRYLARGPQYASYSTAEAMRYLRDRISLPRAQYVGACWQAPYRGHNCFGDSVQGPQYYRPFRGSFSCDPEMAIKVGGVCGALSNLGTAAAIANGIPATSMGEPGHCAYAVQVRPQTWQPAYSLSWKRGMHNWLYRPTWQSLLLTQEAFKKPQLVKKSNDLVRLAHWYEAQGNTRAAEGKLREAVNVHPVHYGAWVQWAEFGQRQDLPAMWWKRYGMEVMKTLAQEHEEPAWALLSKYAYSNVLPRLKDNQRALFFAQYMESFDDFGDGRWNIEGAWNWMLKHLSSARVKEMFKLRLTHISIPKASIGSAVLAWMKQQCGDNEKAWLDFQEWLVNDLAKQGEGKNVDAVIRQLGRTSLPAAAERGDLASYQTIGKLCSSLYEPMPTDGIEPFTGELLTEGGAIRISGIGQRYDSPERHWGVLNMHGGSLHTNSTETPWIEVRLGNFGQLNGLVIQNRKGGFMWRANGARVLASTDGKSWEQIGKLEGSKLFYRIDLTDEKPRAGYIRIERDGHCMHFARILAYGKRLN
ncbi:hypothetical protein STSP2_02219 [Anaerohalosphaera lusitana]|uniref:F5/8 type C domain protein n=1 Tax=Anaerohalosphaera lusitana TaxID=1936003 RepID=A0A1U9NMT5_9BACT|nr:discoidin domain-containing protein [Anaerohalosphaera lusitana]AQT69038.1 hypothetical protein STSP2_02219 [Anaerohalosphaera lusitana]